MLYQTANFSLFEFNKLLGSGYKLHILKELNINTYMIGVVGGITYSKKRKMIECVAFDVIFLLHVMYLLVKYSVLHKISFIESYRYFHLSM